LAKAKDLTFKAKDSKFVVEDISRPRTKAKDNNTVDRPVSSVDQRQETWGTPDDRVNVKDWLELVTSILFRSVR